MQIADLPCLEEISEEKILGGDSYLSMTATATALGDASLAKTNTDISLRQVGKGKVTIGKANGSALAIGDEHYAAVVYGFEGFDRVIVNERSNSGKNHSFQQVKLIALDLPW